MLSLTIMAASQISASVMPSPPTRSLVNGELTTMSLAWNTMRRSSRSLPSSTRLSTAAAATSLNVLHIGKRSLPRCSIFAPEPVSMHGDAEPAAAFKLDAGEVRRQRVRQAGCASRSPVKQAPARQRARAGHKIPPCRHIPSVGRKTLKYKVAAAALAGMTLAKSGTLRGEIVTLLRLLGGGRLQHRLPARRSRLSHRPRTPRDSAPPCPGSSRPAR